MELPRATQKLPLPYKLSSSPSLLQPPSTERSIANSSIIQPSFQKCTPSHPFISTSLFSMSDRISELQLYHYFYPRIMASRNGNANPRGVLDVESGHNRGQPL
jgi:hypothetical protein